MDSYSGYLHTLRPGVGKVHSPCNSSLVTFFSASTFSIFSGSLQKHNFQWALMGDGVTHTQTFPGQRLHQTHWVSTLLWHRVEISP